MRGFAFVSALAAVALAQDSSSEAASSSSIDPAPQTSYLQQTNSLGVITGGPPVATSQPAADTSIPAQPPADTSIPALPPGASIPAQASGIHTVVIPIGNNSTVQVVVSAANTTTIVYGAPSTAPASGSGAETTGTGKASGTGRASGSGADATGSGAAATGTQASAPGAAANVQVASGFLGAALLAAFL